MKKQFLIISALAMALCSCHNDDIEFDNFDYQTIYFAKQTPVRTLTMGDDGELNMADDNAHRFYIKAALGGVNVNKDTHWATFVVDNTLCDNLTFSDGRPVRPMPAQYYTLSDDVMYITPGNVIGGVGIQLTDAFFADPDAIDLNYVIPIRLTSSGDSILSGKSYPGLANPNRLITSHWSIQPKDYTLYAVKYKNAYHGCWLSQGVDMTDNRGDAKTITRKPGLWEKATLRYLTTRSLTRSAYSFSFTVPVIDAAGDKSERAISCDLLLDINDKGECTVTTETPGCTASGSGQWRRQGEPKAWGDKDRDVLTLNYNFAIDYVYNESTGEHATYKYSSDEKLVMRDRQNHSEEFKFTIN